jgi:hypothetical protein
MNAMKDLVDRMRPLLGEDGSLQEVSKLAAAVAKEKAARTEIYKLCQAIGKVLDDVDPEREGQGAAHEMDNAFLTALTALADKFTPYF